MATNEVGNTVLAGMGPGSASQGVAGAVPAPPSVNANPAQSPGDAMAPNSRHGFLRRGDKVNRDDLNAAKAALKIPKGPLSPEEMADAIDAELLKRARAKADAAKISTPLTQSTTGGAGTPAGAGANPIPRPGGTNAPRAPLSPEDLAGTLSEIFGQAEVALAKPGDPGIPERLQINEERAAALKWKLPEVVAGVVCGRLPQPLQAIVFIDAEQLAAFKAANPALKDSTVTWWPREPSSSTAVLWLRCPDGIAGNVACGPFTWIGNGLVPVAEPNLDARHFLHRHGSIACIRFAEIKWPPGVADMFVVPRLEQSYGPKYQRINGKRIILNATFWAHLVGHKTGFEYIFGENKFFVEDEGKSVHVADEAVLKIVMEILRQASALDHGFPTAGLRPAVAKQVVEELKLAVARILPGREETLNEYLDLRVEKRCRQSVTVEELYADYGEFCRATSRPPYMPPVFTRLIADAIENKFGVLRSHDLERTGSDGFAHARRGFHWLGLKEQNQEAADGPDAPDAADGPDATAQSPKIETPALAT